MANLAAAGLTRERNTPVQELDYAPIDAPVQDNVKIWNGGIVCLEPVAGYAVPGADTANYKAMGVAYETADNTVTGHSAGGIRVPYRVGVFAFDTGGSAAIVQTDVGHLAYVLDDHTVVEAGGTNNSVIAGVVVALDPYLVGANSTNMVWVDMRRKSA